MEVQQCDTKFTSGRTCRLELGHKGVHEPDMTTEPVQPEVAPGPEKRIASPDAIRLNDGYAAAIGGLDQRVTAIEALLHQGAGLPIAPPPSTPEKAKTRSRGKGTRK